MEYKADFLSLLLTHLPGAVYCKDFRSRVFDFVNESVFKLTGLESEYFLQLGHDDFVQRIHPEDRQEYTSTYAKLLTADHSSSDSFFLKYRFKHSSGSYIELIDRANILRTSTGEVDKLIGYFDAVEPLIASKDSFKTKLPSHSNQVISNDFRAMADLLHEGIWQIDAQSKTVYANPRVAEMLGYTPDEMLGKDLLEFMDEEEVNSAHHYLARRHQGKSEQHKFSFLHKNGQRVYAYLASSPLHNSDGLYFGSIAAVSDITALVQAERELQEKEELMRDITNSLPGQIMSYIIRPDGSDQILFISEGVKKLYEVSPEDAMRDSSLIWNRIHPDDLNKMISSVQESAQNMTPWYLEFRVLLPDGRIKWLCGHAQPRKLADGSTLWNTLTLDETEKITAQKKLIESEKRMERILKGSDDVYWEYDLVSKQVFYSERWWQMFGYENDEVPLEQMDWKEWVHPEDKLKVEKAINDAIESDKDSYEVESRRMHKNGHFVPVLGRGTITRNENGEPILISGTLFDMSKIKSAEERLRESELKFRSLVEGVESVIYTYNLDLEFTYVSPSSVQSTGYQPEELKTKSPFELIHTDDLDDFKLFVTKLLINKQPQKGIEYRIIKKDGTSSWRSGSVTPLMNDQGEVNGYLGISHNIDVLKQKETELAEAIAMKDKLFSIIGHDLKSPLNSILGLTEIMADNVNRGEVEEVKELFEWVRKASQKSVDLLSNLLEWARSQTNELQFAPEPEKVEPLFRLSAEMVEEAAAEKQIKIDVAVDSDLEVLADANMLRTILRNLLSNAIKYTFQHGVIKLSARRDGQNALFSVKDNGVGIADQDLDKLFAPDQPHTTLGTKKEKGTGLGLILCKDFVERQGGKIWVESNKNKGTAFFFTLPLA